jgi:hypothetical protein
VECIELKIQTIQCTDKGLNFVRPVIFHGRSFVRPVIFTGGLLSALSFSREGFCPPCQFWTGRLLSGRAFVLHSIVYTGSMCQKKNIIDNISVEISQFLLACFAFALLDELIISFYFILFRVMRRLCLIRIPSPLSV